MGKAKVRLFDTSEMMAESKENKDASQNGKRKRPEGNNTSKKFKMKMK